MAYDSAKPANDGYLADAPQELRTNFEGLKNDQIVNAGTLKGLSPGNASGNIPISNGNVNTNLNADKLDGLDASAFATASHVHSTATSSSNGFMSNTDKSKLDGIATGAEVNQNAFSNVLVGGTTIQADSKTDTLELVAGTNISLTPDTTNDRVTINNTYSHPTGDGNLHVPATGTSNNGKVLKAGSTAGSIAWGTLTAADITNSDYFVHGDSSNTGSVNTCIEEGKIGANSLMKSCFYRDNNSNFGALGIHIQHPSNNQYALQISSTEYDTNILQVRSKVNGTWNTPKTLATTDQIPTSLPANGGNADTVDGKHAGNSANNVLVLDENGKVPTANLPTINADTFIKPALNASGDAPIYACRAWVNFDGTTTPPTISASGNVSSVTKLGTGVYEVNFAQAMPHNNYVVFGMTNGDDDSSNGTAIIAMPLNPSMSNTKCLIWATSSDTRNSLQDKAHILVAFIC